MSKEMDFLPEPPERYVACQHLDFNPVRASLTSDLQNHKTINVCCFQPRGVWWFQQQEENDVLPVIGFGPSSGHAPQV